MQTGYVFEFQGSQFTPEGKLPEPIDAAAYNAELDRETTEQMKRGEPTILYLSERTETGNASVTGKPYEFKAYSVGTWAGTWKCHAVRISKSWHNMAGKDGRTDAWFTAFGHNWHGVNIGDSQILRCRVVKGRTHR